VVGTAETVVNDVKRQMADAATMPFFAQHSPQCPPGIAEQLRSLCGVLGTGQLGELEERLNRFCEESGSVKAALKKSVHTVVEALKHFGRAQRFACDRLEDINSSYTLYRDLVITDSRGVVIANSNSARRSAVLGRCVSDEAWFQKALKTKSGTEYIAQDLKRSLLEPQLSLVYATAVRENCDENGAVQGTMGVFFDFQGEAQIILEEYMPHDERGKILEGCYSMFTNEQGQVIASNDDTILQVGANALIPRANRTLEPGERSSSYLVFAGIDSAIFSAKTDGYLDY
jgi:hypothetical protein